MSKALAAAVPTADIDTYISSAFRVPVLTLEEEIDLARRVREHGDMAAAHRMVMAHVRFVVRIARGYLGYGLPLSDLVQEGSVGLVKAVQRFDPDVGVRLVSFAVHWIRAEIHEYILRNWRIVKVATTKAQRKLFFNLRSSKKRLGWFSREEVDEVAATLGVSPQTVLEMEQRLASHDVAFDAGDADDDDAPSAPADYLPDLSQDPTTRLERLDSEQDKRRRLRDALETLDARSRGILEQRWLGEKKLTLAELAEQFGVTAERIRQIEKAAIGELRGKMCVEAG